MKSPALSTVLSVLLVSSLLIGVYVTERYFPVIAEGLDRVKDGIFQDGESFKEQMEYSLFCWFYDLDSTFLQRIKDAQISVFFLASAKWNQDNTLRYIVSNSQWDDFISQITAIIPNAKFVPTVFSWGEAHPDLTTNEKRQQCVNEMIQFATWRSDFDGILDDTEVYLGTPQNQYAFFESCSIAIENEGLPYYPWVRYNNIIYVETKRHAVGIYDSHAYLETQWKQAIDFVQNHANVGYSITIIKENPEREEPTIAEQLVFMNDQLSQHGEDFYSKMETFGIYRYEALTEEDWNAWNAWVRD